VASRLRLDMASYRELAAFAQFGSDLDKSARGQLERGKRLQEVLKQPQYQPMPVERQIVVLFAATNGYADGLRVDAVPFWEKDLLSYIHSHYPRIYESILAQKMIASDTEALLREAIQTFNRTWKSQDQ